MKKQRTIGKHIRQVVTIGIIVMVIVMELCSIISIKKALRNDVESELLMEASAKKDFVENWLAKKQEETEIIAASIPGLAYMSDDEIMDYMTKCAATDSDILNFYYCRADRKYVVYNGGIFELEPQSRSWWSDTWAKGSTLITDAYVDANSGSVVVSVATPVYIDDVQCVILADITMDKMVENIKSAEGSDTSVFLVASDGTVIVHKNADYLMKTDGSSSSIADIYKIDMNATGIQKADNENGRGSFFALSTVEQTGWVLGCYEQESVIKTKVTKAVAFILIVATLVAIIGLLFFANMLKKQLEPMTNMKGFIKSAVVGEENVPFYRDEKKEIAFLIDELQNSFVATIRKTKGEMENIDGAIRDTSSSVTDIVDAVNDISAVIEETASSMDTQTENIANISDDCNTIANATQSVASQAQEMARRANSMVEHVNTIVPQMKAEREKVVQTSEESRERLMAAVKEAECINEITNISDAIKSIAEQTNLLSLNASIESARAGEAGRGFAVVAEEIRGLSDETGNEINKITDLTNKLLKAVGTLTQESTETMNTLTADIEQVYGQMDELAGEYKENAEYYANVSSDLGASSEELSASVQAVAASVDAISSSQQDVNKAMESASDNIQNVALDSQDMKKKVEYVSQSVYEVSDTIGQFNV